MRILEVLNPETLVYEMLRVRRNRLKFEWMVREIVNRKEAKRDTLSGRSCQEKKYMNFIKGMRDVVAWVTMQRSVTEFRACQSSEIGPLRW